MPEANINKNLLKGTWGAQFEWYVSLMKVPDPLDIGRVASMIQTMHKDRLIALFRFSFDPLPDDNTPGTLKFYSTTNHGGSIKGKIVNGETAILCNAVRSMPGKNAVILDLARVTTVDAHGLGVLLKLRQQSLANGTRFKLMNLSGLVRKVFEIARLDSVFEFTSEVEVFSAFSLAHRAPVAA